MCGITLIASAVTLLQGELCVRTCDISTEADETESKNATGVPDPPQVSPRYSKSQLICNPP